MATGHDHTIPSDNTNRAPLSALVLTSRFDQFHTTQQRELMACEQCDDGWNFVDYRAGVDPVSVEAAV